MGSLVKFIVAVILYLSIICIGLAGTSIAFISAYLILIIFIVYNIIMVWLAISDELLTYYDYVDTDHYDDSIHCR